MSNGLFDSHIGLVSEQYTKIYKEEFLDYSKEHPDDIQSLYRNLRNDISDIVGTRWFQVLMVYIIPVVYACFDFIYLRLPVITISNITHNCIMCWIYSCMLYILTRHYYLYLYTKHVEKKYKYDDWLKYQSSLIYNFFFSCLDESSIQQSNTGYAINPILSIKKIELYKQWLNTDTIKDLDVHISILENLDYEFLENQ